MVIALALTSCSKGIDEVNVSEETQNRAELRDTDTRLTVNLSMTNNTGEYCVLVYELEDIMVGNNYPETLAIPGNMSGTFPSVSGTRTFQVYNNIGYWLQGGPSAPITLNFKKLEDSLNDYDMIGFTINVTVKDHNDVVLGTSKTSYIYEKWNRGVTVVVPFGASARCVVDVDIVATGKGSLW